MANKFCLQQILKKDILFFLISFLLVVIFIGPFLYISQYIYLSQDDFCRVNIPLFSYISRIGFWYLNENGRYINAFMSLLPVYDLRIYRLIPVLMILSLLICIIYFVRNLCSNFDLKIPVHIAVFVGILVTIQVFLKLPFIFEFVYWYAGVTVYFVSILLFLLFLNSLIVFDFSKKRSLLLISLLIIGINGNNEMALILVNFILFLILIAGAVLKYNYLKSILILNIISWISSVPLLFANSSDARRSYFEKGGDLLFSIESSFLSAASFTVKNIFGFPDFLLWIGLAALLIHTGVKGENREIKSIKISPILLAIFSFLALMSQMFVIYYAVGLLEAYGGRIANFIHSVFIILVLINVINLTVFVKEKWPSFIKKIQLPRYIIIVLSSFLIYNGLIGKNYKQVIYDLSSGKAKKYKENIEDRLIYLASTNKSNIEFETIDLPKTITNLDLRTVPYWENDCFIDLINKKYNKNIKSIIRIE